MGVDPGTLPEAQRTAARIPRLPSSLGEALEAAAADQGLLLRARVATVSAYLKTFTPADFEGAATRVIALPFIPGKGLRGDDYLRELATPNFYFHVTTAYSILRHNGVDLGKIDFIGSLNLCDA